MNFYKRFCSTISERLIESRINARLYSGSVANVWLDAYSTDAAFFKSLRIMFAKYSKKPFRKCTNQDLRNIDAFLLSIDKYEFVSFLKYGKLRDLDLDKLDELIQNQGLLEAANEEVLALKKEVAEQLGELHYAQDFEHEPAHLYIKSKFNSSVYNPGTDIEHQECVRPQLVVDHFVKARSLEDGNNLTIAEEDRLIHENVKHANTTIFHPDEYAIIEAVSQCQVGVPTQWLKYRDIYSDSSVVITKNVSHLIHAKMAVIVLPDRSTFEKRAIGRYTVSKEVACRWYDQILQGIVAVLDPSRMYVEFVNCHLMRSRLWISVSKTLNLGGYRTPVPSTGRPPDKWACPSKENE